MKLYIEDDVVGKVELVDPTTEEDGIGKIDQYDLEKWMAQTYVIDAIRNTIEKIKVRRAKIEEEG